MSTPEGSAPCQEPHDVYSDPPPSLWCGSCDAFLFLTDLHFSSSFAFHCPRCTKEIPRESIEELP